MDNEENSKKFRLVPKEGIYEKYIGGYYLSHPIGTTDQYIGKIKKIDFQKGKIILNPYFGSSYNRKSRKNLYSLIKKDCDIFVDLSKISFEPITKKGILYNCYLSNKGNIDESKSFFERFKLAYKILMNKIG